MVENTFRKSSQTSKDAISKPFWSGETAEMNRLVRTKDDKKNGKK